MNAIAFIGELIRSHRLIRALLRNTCSSAVKSADKRTCIAIRTNAAYADHIVAASDS